MPLSTLHAPLVAVALRLGQASAQSCLLHVGCRIEVLPLPWARALIGLDAGHHERPSLGLQDGAAAIERRFHQPD